MTKLQFIKGPDGSKAHMCLRVIYTFSQSLGPGAESLTSLSFVPARCSKVPRPRSFDKQVCGFRLWVLSSGKTSSLCHNPAGQRCCGICSFLGMRLHCPLAFGRQRDTPLLRATGGRPASSFQGRREPTTSSSEEWATSQLSLPHGLQGPA